MTRQNKQAKVNKSTRQYKKPKEPKPRLFILYEEDIEGGEALDDGEWANHAPTTITVRFLKLHRNQPIDRFFYHSIEIENPDLLKLNRLYLAVVRYSTGDTFGSTSGAWHIVGASPTKDIAQKMLDEALSPDNKGRKPWEGYFEELEGTEICEVGLED